LLVGGGRYRAARLLRTARWMVRQVEAGEG
jgi:hypothetical protein